MSDDVIERLEQFVLDNPDLERLELILDRFNPFTAMGWTRQEVRHSQFLRWLLDPTATHGLGEYPLRRLAKAVAAKAQGELAFAPSVIEVDSWNYDGTFAMAEWNNIDVLVRNDRARFCLVLENKVDSIEHSQQLRRYRKLVEGRFPHYKRLFVYLTVEGEAPADDAYLSLSYAEVADIVAGIIERREDQIGSEVATFCSQYVEMLRRHIVEDSEVQELCEKIYATHKRALDVLFEHRPDKTQELSDFLQDLIGRMPDLTPDHSSKAYVRFVPKAADALPRVGSGWTNSGRLVLFEIDLAGGDIRLKAILGPGDPEVRNSVHRAVLESKEAFNRATAKLYPQWWSFHSERWVTKKQYEEEGLEELKDRLEKALRRFVDEDVPPMVKAFESLQRR